MRRFARRLLFLVPHVALVLAVVWATGLRQPWDLLLAFLLGVGLGATTQTIWRWW